MGRAREWLHPTAAIDPYWSLPPLTFDAPNFETTGSANISEDYPLIRTRRCGLPVPPGAVRMGIYVESRRPGAGTTIPRVLTICRHATRGWLGQLISRVGVSLAAQASPYPVGQGSASPTA